MPSAVAAGRKLSFQDVQIIMASVQPSVPDTNMDALAFIKELDSSLEYDLRNSSEVQKVFTLAREYYGSMRAYTVLQDMVI
jgi:hypothetical protein